MARCPVCRSGQMVGKFRMRWHGAGGEVRRVVIRECNGCGQEDDIDEAEQEQTAHGSAIGAGCCGYAVDADCRLVPLGNR